MNAFDEAGASQSKLPFRNRARRRTELGVERMEPRTLLAAWTGAAAAVPATAERSASERLADEKLFVEQFMPEKFAPVTPVAANSTPDPFPIQQLAIQQLAIQQFANQQFAIEGSDPALRVGMRSVGIRPVWASSIGTKVVEDKSTVAILEDHGLMVCLPAGVSTDRLGESFSNTIVDAPLVPVGASAPALVSVATGFESTLPSRWSSAPAILSAADRDWLAARGLTGKGQIVAIIDSGIAYRHEAFGGGLGPTARVVGGFDFAEGDVDPNDDAPAGYHGTHVAGIVGGQDGSRSGVAPEVALVALRVFDDQGTTRPEWIESALRWVSDHRTSFAWPITTVNLSLGALGGNAEQSLRSALEDDLRRLHEEGVFVAVAAGNRFGAKSTTGVGYPASSEWVTPVAAVDGSGRLAGFSERQAGILAAPGETVVSTVPDFLTGADGRYDDYWATSGTSMAAPQVAAASVLARQAWSGAGLGEPTVEQLEEALRAGADTRVDGATGIEFAVFDLRRTIAWIESQAENSYVSNSVTAREPIADDQPPFRVPRIRIPQFPAVAPTDSTLPRVVVGDGESATIATIPLASSAAVPLPQPVTPGAKSAITPAMDRSTGGTTIPDSLAADERMRAIDLVFRMLGR